MVDRINTEMLDTFVAEAFLVNGRLFCSHLECTEFIIVEGEYAGKGRMRSIENYVK
ncbi:MAG: hypothetical protein H6611_09515 [Ignavibacteriales bacterium]|nr:hypothetical protein [Ignavibacteriales bacterium]